MEIQETLKGFAKIEEKMRLVARTYELDKYKLHNLCCLHNSTNIVVPQRYYTLFYEPCKDFFCISRACNVEDKQHDYIKENRVNDKSEKEVIR